MNRAALIAIAAAVGWGAGLAAAHAGDSADRSPVHHARVKAPAIAKQHGTTLVEKHKPKQRAARRLSTADKTGTKHATRVNRADRERAKQSGGHVPIARADKSVTSHAYRGSRDDRQRVKQSRLHVPIARADKTLIKHADRGSRSERPRVKQSGSHVAVVREGKAEPKHAARANRDDRLKVKQGGVAPLVRVNGRGPKHQIASLDDRKLKHGQKVGRSKAKKSLPAVRKQKVRHAASGRT